MKSIVVSAAVLALAGVFTAFAGCSDEACHTETGCESTHGAGGEATGTGGAGAQGGGGGDTGGVAAGGEGGTGGA